MVQENMSRTLKEVIEKHSITLVYFGSDSCGVCTAIRPKVDLMLKEYPLIHGVHVDAEKSPMLAAEYQVFAIPALLVYIDGKEILREARFIDLYDVSGKIDRYYHMIFME